MSILIKGMEMPKSCTDCRFLVDGWCYAALPGSKEERIRTSFYCPLVELPPHGRLIDADALKNSLSFAENTAKWAVPALRAVLMVIDEMPTIIPAEESET